MSQSQPVIDNLPQEFLLNLMGRNYEFGSSKINSISAELAALLYMSFTNDANILQKIQLNGGTNIQILINSSEYVNKLIYLYCLKYLGDNKLTEEQYASLKEKINFTNKYQDYVKELFTNPNAVFFLKESIDKYTFNTNVEEIFITELCAEYDTAKSHNLMPGYPVCGCTLIEKISEKEHSQIWKAKRGIFFVCIKMESIDEIPKKITQGGNFYKKMTEFLSDGDVELENYKKLNSFANKVKFLTIDYYGPLKLKVKIMPWIDVVPITDKKKYILELFQLFQNLNKAGFCFLNISPSHILYSSSGCYLIDWRNLRKSGEGSITHFNSYTSLSILRGALTVSFYDDLESLLYYVNEILYGKVTYTNENEEKTSLSLMSGNIALYINSLRNARINDNVINDDTIVFGNHVNGIYNYVINNFINQLLDSYVEINVSDIDLPEIDKARIVNIKTQLLADNSFVSVTSNPALFDEFALKILNYMTNCCQYDQETNILISKFLYG